MSGLGTSSTNVNQSSQTGPLPQSIPFINNQFQDIGLLQGGYGNGVSPPVKQAYQGANKVAGGLPNPAIAANNVGQGLLTGDPTGILGKIQGSIGDINNPAGSPGMAGLLSNIRTDVGNSVNSQFAGAGRSLSGDNEMAVARGIAQGEAPTLANQYNANTGTMANIAAAMTGNKQTGLSDVASAFPLSGLPAQTAASNIYGPAVQAAQFGGTLENLGIPMAGLGGTTQGSVQGTQNASLASILGSLLGGSNGGIIGNGLGLGSTIGKAIL